MSMRNVMMGMIVLVVGSWAGAGCGGSQEAAAPTVQPSEPAATDEVPAWCEPEVRLSARVIGDGYAASLLRAGDRNLLVMRGGLGCPQLRDMVERLQRELEVCAAQGCSGASGVEAWHEANDALAGAPLHAVLIGDVEVLVTGQGELAMAVWPAQVGFDQLAKGFQFPEPMAPGVDMTRGPTTSAPPPGGSSTGATASIEACIAVPCLPSQCGSGRPIDRDSVRLTTAEPTCACASPGGAVSAAECAAVSERSCACFSQCCAAP